MTVATETRIMVETDKYSDGQLLAAVDSRAEQDCFAELVRRHGPMVLGVCRRQLGERHDAEDAAQAVFLVLWKKARALRRHSSVAGWLHQVAVNICRNAQRAKTVRKKHELAAGVHSKGSNDRHHEEWDRMKDLLDDELDALPEKYRTPIVLFHLEGRSLDETGALLRMQTSTLTTRLQRGRDMLRRRLARRGITISSAALATWFSENVAKASMPLFFAETTAKAANLYAMGQPAAGGLVSAQTIALTKGAIDMFSITKMKLAVSLLSALVLIAGGGSILMWQPAVAGKAKDSTAKPRQKKQLAATTQPKNEHNTTVDLGKERIQFEKYDPDNLPSKLITVGFYKHTDLPHPKHVYEQRLDNKLGSGHYELVGRVPGGISSGAKFEPMSFTRAGKNITARIRYSHAPLGASSFYSHYFRVMLPHAPSKLALPPGTYDVKVIFEDHKVSPIVSILPAIKPMTCRLVVPGINPTKNEPTPMEKLEKHIAWGKPGKNGLQAGVVLDPHKDAYSIGDKVRSRFFYRNTGVKPITITPPKLLESRVTKLYVTDDGGKPITVRTKSDKEPLWIVGAYVVTLHPGKMTEVNGSYLAIGKGDEDNALINVVKAKAGQTCRLRFTLNDYTGAAGNELTTGTVQFKVAAGDGIIKQLKSRKDRGTLRDIYEKITLPNSFSKRDELSRTYPLRYLPAGDKAGMLGEWFDRYKDGKFEVTTNDNNWLLFRSKQLDQLVRMWIRRIERNGNTLVIHMTRSTWIGSYTFNVRYHDVFGVNLGKLPAGKYSAKWIIDEATHMKYDKSLWPIDDAVVKPNVVVLSTDFEVVAFGKQGSGQDTSTLKQNANKDLSLVVKPVQHEFAFGKPPTFFYEYKNSSKETLVGNLDWNAHDIKVTDLKSGEIWEFTYGSPAPPLPPPTGNTGKAVDIELPAGKTRIESPTFGKPLYTRHVWRATKGGGCVEHLPPGKYRAEFRHKIEASRDFPVKAKGKWRYLGGTVQGNSVEFTIAAKKPIPKAPSLSLQITPLKWTIDGKIKFTCTFHNPTTDDIHIPGWGQMDYPVMLEIRDEDGKLVYVDGGRDRLKKISMAEAYPHIKPGQSHQFQIAGKLNERRQLVLPELLGGWWMWHKLDAGKNTVRAILDTTQSEKHLALAEKGLNFKVWRGKLVSDPVAIEIPKAPVITMHRWPGYGKLGSKSILEFIVYGDGTFRYKDATGRFPQMAVDHLQQQIAKADVGRPTEDAETLTFRWWDEKGKEHETIFTSPAAPDRQRLPQLIGTFAERHAVKGMTPSKPAQAER